jgi:hypothetical protein
VTIRPIVSFELDDSKMQRFQELFQKYQEALSKSPAAWAEVSDSQKPIAQHVQKITAALLAQQQIAKDNDEDDERRVKRLEHSEKLWMSIARSSNSVAKAVLDVGSGMLKWGAVLGTGLLGGSLFGIDKIAEGVADRRRSAMGLGMSIGEMRSFDIDFGRVADPNFLAKVADMQSDPSKQWSLASMGVSARGSTNDVAVNLLKAIHQRAVNTPVTQLGMLDAMTGLGLGTANWRLQHNMGAAEFNALVAAQRRDISSLDPGVGTARAWQDFTTQMSRAGEQIFNVFVKGLAPLAVPLTDLSGAVAKAVSTFLKGDVFKEGIDNLSNALTNFSGTLSKPEFLKKIEQFTSDVGGLADAVHTVSDAVQHPGQAIGKAVVWDLTQGQKARWNAIGSMASGAWGWASQKLGAAHVGFLDEKYGLPKGMLEFVWAKESASSMEGPDQPGPNGARGPFQIKPSMANGAYLHDFLQSSERAAQILAAELRRYHGDVEMAVAAYNVGDPTLDKLVAKYGKDWKAHVPYLAGIKVENATGGSAQVTVNAMAGGGF